VECSLRGILEPAGDDHAAAAAFRISNRYFYPGFSPRSRLGVLRRSEARARPLSDAVARHRLHRRSASVDEHTCASLRTAVRMHPRAPLIEPQRTLAQNDRLPNRRLK